MDVVANSPSVETKELLFQSEESLKTHIPPLRVRRDRDGCYIATTIIKRLKGDHLYFHGPGKLGIYYQGNTKRQTSEKKKWWANLILGTIHEDLSMQGEFDGLLIYKPYSHNDIPSPFYQSNRGNFSGKGWLKPRQQPAQP